MRRFVLTLAMFIMTNISHAEMPVTIEDNFGVLNPQDTGVQMLKRKIEMGVTDSVTCALGYNVTKYTNQKLARKFSRQCAEAGYTKAMTWMSHREDNGLGGDYNPDAAAKWDRRASQAGDTVGKFNHGLNLMRGHGIAKDEVAGRSFIDQAAKDGLAIAKRLKGADYDLDEVTPDSDNWKYAPFY